MIHWLLHDGRWHAWEHGERASACGRINVEHLRASQTAAILADALEPEWRAAACRACLRIVDPPTVPGELVPGGNGARAWLGYLRLHLRRVHASADARDLAAVAARLAALGPPDDPTAQEAFEHLRTVLLTPIAYKDKGGRHRRRIPDLGEAMRRLPPDPRILARVAAAVRAWRVITGRADPGRFRPDAVVEAILALPAGVESYVRHLAGRGLDSLAVVFHPNTLARARRDPALRGLFGTGAAYLERVEDQLNVVTD